MIPPCREVVAARVMMVANMADLFAKPLMQSVREGLLKRPPVMVGSRRPIGFISEPNKTTESPGVKPGLRNVAIKIIRKWVERQSQENSVLTLY